MTKKERNTDYLNNGVKLSPQAPSLGETVKIVYNGLLVNSGAVELTAHVGFGSNWNSTYDFKMTKTTTGFETQIPVTTNGPIQLAFKDSANNWDNNCGWNYTFETV